MIHASSFRATLDDAYASAAPHLKPIVAAVRDLHCGMFFVSQSNQPFRLPNDPTRPAIAIIGDDMHCAVGPTGFHMPSVRRIIRASSGFAIISCAPLPHIYETMAASAALTRRNVLLIETRPEQEILWLGLIQTLAPRRHVLLATVEGGHA